MAGTASSSTLKSVLDLYLNIHEALARDSMKNVSANAKAIAEVARADETKRVPAAIAEEAAKLAKTRQIWRAREAFKVLSESLIASLRTNPAPPGIYYEFYCPTVKASWLQRSKIAINPYLGWRAETPTWGWACPAVQKAIFGGPVSGNPGRPAGGVRRDIRPSGL